MTIILWLALAVFLLFWTGVLRLIVASPKWRRNWRCWAASPLVAVPAVMKLAGDKADDWGHSLGRWTERA